MKLTQKQIDEFKEQQKILKNKIQIYREGIWYPQQYNEQPECARTYWLEELEKAINDINLEEGLIWNIKIDKISDAMYGWYVARYITSIENVVISEFGTLISPMNSIIVSYGVAIYNILINKN